MIRQVKIVDNDKQKPGKKHVVRYIAITLTLLIVMVYLAVISYVALAPEPEAIAAELMPEPTTELTPEPTPEPTPTPMPEPTPTPTPEPELLEALAESRLRRRVRRPRIDPSLPMVALTFDDGPSNLTDQILDILEHHDVVATFYVIGRKVEPFSDTVQRAYYMGCEIANHTWSHRSLVRISNDSIRTQLQDTNAAIENVIGVQPSSMRPPFGNSNSNVESISEELGLAVVFWSIDPSDYLERSVDTIYSHIMDAVQDKDIILLHDVHERSVEATRHLVPSLIRRGYQLVTVSELMYYSDITLEPGANYRHGRS